MEQSLLAELRESCDDALDNLRRNMSKLKTGKANPAMVEDIRIKYYGSQAPISQVASVNVVGGNTIVVEPWDVSQIKPIEKAIAQSNLGLTPNNDGDVIRIQVPPLTIDRGKELAKVVKGYGEQSKISIRGYRQKANKYIDREYDKEQGKHYKNGVQEVIDKYVKEVYSLVKEKNKDFTEFKSSIREVIGKL